MKIPDSLALLAIQTLATTLKLLPERWAMGCGRRVGTFAFYFSGRRKVAYADLKASLGPNLSEPDRWRILREHYASLGQTAVEMLRFPFLDPKDLAQMMTIDQPERLEEVIKEKGGAIFLAAHFGNWELSQMTSVLYNKRLHVLARDQRYARLNDYLNRLRKSQGTIAVARRGMGIRQLLRALRRGEYIALLGDQDAGKLGGTILPFLGRKTTVPTGAFELARRTQSPIIPCFIVRRPDGKHELCVGETIRVTDDNSVETALRMYLGTLEDFIRRFPSEWLWESKRWKYSWTKRLLILSDGKPGHVKQAEAVAAQFQSLPTQYGRPGMEYPIQTIVVHFRSEFCKRLFPWCALFFIPWAQGRLRTLSFFFTPETQKALERSSADFIVSAGSSITALNLILARDSHAKSVVVMKPSFPFNLFHYDLALIPAHDSGWMPRETFRTLLAPSDMEPEALEEATRKLEKAMRAPSRVKFAVFLGGPTRHFGMDLADMERFFSTLGRIAEFEGDYVVTTSRRTPVGIAKFLKERLSRDPACQLFVIASEDRRPEVASGMMGLAEILIVTEDSISMISEAVSAGKKVIVLTFGANGLPAKHRRFQEILARESAVRVARPEDLEEKIRSFAADPAPLAFQEERDALRDRLQEIL